MNKVITIFGAMCFLSTILTSCEGEGIQKKVDSSNEAKKTNIKIDTIKTIEAEDIVPTIKIGQDEWMTEDLNVSTYNNGDPIKEAKGEKAWVDCNNKKIGCFRKLNNGTYVYNGFAISDKRGIVPSGFTIPTYKQFEKLITFLGGGDSQTGRATKSLATYSIYVQDWVGDDETGGIENVEIKSNGNSGFNAKQGGFVYDQGSIGNEGNCSFWWTSTSTAQGQIVVDIGNCSQDLGGGKGVYPSTYGFAVRAIKN